VDAVTRVPLGSAGDDIASGVGEGFNDAHDAPWQPDRGVLGTRSTLPTGSGGAGRSSFLGHSPDRRISFLGISVVQSILLPEEIWNVHQVDVGVIVACG
jgi:hypothetical protein